MAAETEAKKSGKELGILSPESHGPKYYLSVSKPKQKPVMDYIPLDYQTQVTEYLDNFRQIKTILEELCEINRELLRRREKF